MQTIILNVLKKNRKYFACTTETGYKARLLIDDNSSGLELGEQELTVNDLSKRTKYGTDLIFALAADLETIKSSGIVTLSHFMYNADLVDDCKQLGGKWDAEEKCWVFSDIIADKVELLDSIYNSDLVSVEITNIAKDCDGDGEYIIGDKKPVYFLGYVIARASGKNSGAVLGDNIALMLGTIESGGSVKHWETVITNHSVFRLKIPSLLLDQYSGRHWKVDRL